MDARERLTIHSVKDWERVKNDYRLTAMAQLEEQIRSQGLASQRDALIEHLNRYIERAFELAKPNLRVNGRNYEDVEADENVEPFDEALDRHIWSLADNRLNWHTNIATARRTKPMAISSAIRDGFALQAEMDAQAPPPIVHVGGVEEDDGVHDANIQSSAQQASAIGHELSQTIPSQHERSERSKVVAAEIKMMKP
ncbi:hypothetical protein BDN71DRAFT_1424269 [Pleurotus eryngii]|uniref:Uncharacterized protein n=1 Tax=Pleurotus eryngii TaxID=5323 RepID=A0A9P5ZL30_PLEER|nr:hypothetical protein BDN71DRAFT_1424269 [Pleurotus eryngii]